MKEIDAMDVMLFDIIIYIICMALELATGIPYSFTGIALIISMFSLPVAFYLAFND